MKPAPFTYHRPASLDQALGLLAEQPNARILAGGQSLMAMLNLRLANPDHLIDVSRIPGIDEIRDDDGAVVMGAMTRQRKVEQSALVQSRLPLLAEAITHVGHQQTRNWGTVGGSLCHLDPSAEIPAMAMAYDAVLTVQSVRGTRQIEMKDFALGMMTPGIDADEMLTSVRFRPWPQAHGTGFSEFARRHGDFAIATGAAMVALDASGRIARASLTLAGVAGVPLRLADAEQALVGCAADACAAIVADAVEAASVDASDDPFAPAWYRRRIAAVVMRKAFQAAIFQAEGQRQ